jgi:ATP-dependent Clp protease ATP-binding subunit ClpX
MYELPSTTGVARCVIDGDVVARKVNPTLVPREAPKRQRQERTA